MLATAAVVGLGAAAAAGAAGAATTYKVYTKKKRNKEKLEGHRRMINIMRPQWETLLTNDSVDPSIFPKTHIEAEGKDIIPLSGIHSVGMGWADRASQSRHEIQLVVVALDAEGRVVGVVSSENKRETKVEGIKHSGLRREGTPERKLSGMPDKNNVVLKLRKIPANVTQIVVGSIMKNVTDSVKDMYITLFKGTDVTGESGGEEALVRYYLNAKECGINNAYIMGHIKRAAKGWEYNPVRVALQAKDIPDFVPRMQLLGVPMKEAEDSVTTIQFTSSTQAAPSMHTVWLGYDRYGYCMFQKELKITDPFPLEEIVSSDGISQIVVVLKSEDHGHDESSTAALSAHVQMEGQKYTFPLSPTAVQVACVFYSYRPTATVPFPLSREAAPWTVVPYATGLPLVDNVPEKIQEHVEKLFVPFQANRVLVTLVEGKNLVIPTGEEGNVLSPRQQKKLDRKQSKITVEVTVSLNDFKTKIPSIPRELNPAWDQILEIPLEPGWQKDESMVSFRLKDGTSKKDIGECAYCLKTLQIPFVGTLKLDNNVGELSFAVNVAEKEGADDKVIFSPRPTPTRE